MDFAWSFVWSAIPALLRGLVVTMTVAVAGLMFSTIIGTTLAILQRVPAPVVQIPVRLYISFLRGTPLLILIFLIYYVLPVVTVDIPPLVAGVAALALNSSAFVCEIVRGGLSAIPKGQFEASRALGLRAVVLWRKVILPQVANLVLAPMLNEFTNCIKATPLLSVITVVEMMRVADKMIVATYRPIEVLFAAALIYFAVNFSLSRVVRRLEARSAVKLA